MPLERSDLFAKTDERNLSKIIEFPFLFAVVVSARTNSLFSVTRPANGTVRVFDPYRKPRSTQTFNKCRFDVFTVVLLPGTD